MSQGRRTSDQLVDDVVGVCRTLVPHQVGRAHDEVTRGLVETLLRGCDDADLADPDVRREVTSAMWSVLDVVEGRPERDPAGAFAAKVTLVVADLRAGLSNPFQPWEGAAVARARARRPRRTRGRG